MPTTKQKIVTLTGFECNMKDYEIKSERIANAQLMVLKSEPGSWAHNYWNTVLNSLQRDWKRSAMEAALND